MPNDCCNGFKRLDGLDHTESGVETTQLADMTNDPMYHDTSYHDAVCASLNKWARGSSQSSGIAAVLGSGFAMGFMVIG